MYAVSVAVPVNPPGVEPVLDRDQVWKGLLMKARDGRPFVGPAMETCDVVEEYADGFLRALRLRGVDMKERITITPKVQVHFQRVDANGYDGWITNLLSDSGDGLLLIFTFNVGFPGAASGSAQEHEMGDRMRDSYVGAIQNTIDETRRRARAGEL